MSYYDRMPHWLPRDPLPQTGASANYEPIDKRGFSLSIMVDRSDGSSLTHGLRGFDRITINNHDAIVVEEANGRTTIAWMRRGRDVMLWFHRSGATQAAVRREAPQIAESVARWTDPAVDALPN